MLLILLFEYRSSKNKYGNIYIIAFCFVPNQYIGSLDVARPNSRVEIVAAMRRIRVSYALHTNKLVTDLGY